jgi:hypothetical protein
VHPDTLDRSRTAAVLLALAARGVGAPIDLTLRGRHLAVCPAPARGALSAPEELTAKQADRLVRCLWCAEHLIASDPPRTELAALLVEADPQCAAPLVYLARARDLVERLPSEDRHAALGAIEEAAGQLGPLAVAALLRRVLVSAPRLDTWLRSVCEHVAEARHPAALSAYEVLAAERHTVAYGVSAMARLEHAARELWLAQCATTPEGQPVTVLCDRQVALEPGAWPIALVALLPGRWEASHVSVELHGPLGDLLELLTLSAPLPLAGTARLRPPGAESNDPLDTRWWTATVALFDDGLGMSLPEAATTAAHLTGHAYRAQPRAEPCACPPRRAQPSLTLTPAFPPRRRLLRRRGALPAAR